jgi:opacity protein-like surface antigen
MTILKTTIKLALGVTTTAFAMVATPVFADHTEHAHEAHHNAAHEAHHGHQDAHHGHHQMHTVETVETHSSSYSHANNNAKVDALEAQLQALQNEVRSLRAQANHPHVDPDTAKVQELEDWMHHVKAEGHHSKDGKDNMVFFRGGYGHNNQRRGGTVDPTVVAGLGSNPNGLLNNGIGDQDAWYFGAGFDFHLADDLFGLMHGTDVFAELMFDYKELGDKQINGLNQSAIDKLTALGYKIPAANSELATVNTLTLAASPKIKFMRGSKFRPWLIPAGFEITVISPPSDAITVTNPGMMFGAGADYNIWKNIFVGADVRYHQSFDNMDGVNPDGLTAGGYLGVGF